MVDNKLPADYPERDALAKAGINTREQVRAAEDGFLAKTAGISEASVAAIRNYEKSRPGAPPQPPPAPKSNMQAAGVKGTTPQGSTAATTQTEKLTFDEAYIYKGTTYGPGSDIEVPKEFADSLRARNLVGNNSTVLSQSPVGSTLAPLPVFVAPDQNFANEQLATGFPGRELLISKNVATRSELQRMSDVDLLNIGATRELIGQIREALRMTQPVR